MSTANSTVFDQKKKTETVPYSALELKKAQNYINRDWAGDHNVSQEAIDWLKDQQMQDRAADVKQSELKTAAEGSEVTSEVVDDSSLLDSIGTGEKKVDEDDTRKEEFLGESIETGTTSTLANTKSRVESKVVSKSGEDVTKIVASDNKDLADKVTKAEKWGKGIGKAGSVVGTIGETYGLGSTLSDMDDSEGPADTIQSLASATTAAASITEKGLSYGAKLAGKKGADATAKSLSTSAASAGKVASVGGAVTGGLSLASDLVSLGELGSKGQDDADVASQLASTAASGLTFGTAVAGATASTGAFATATSVASGAMAFGPVGWAIAGLTILSIGLSDLF